MQSHCSDAAYFGVIAAIGAGAWVAWILGLDPLGSSLLGLMALVGAPAGLVGIVSGVARLPAVPEDFSLTLPAGDDASPIADMFGFDLDIPF